MDFHGALRAPALAMIVEPRMDTNGPGYQTDGSSERLTHEVKPVPRRVNSGASMVNKLGWAAADSRIIEGAPLGKQGAAAEGRLRGDWLHQGRALPTARRAAHGRN